MSSAGCRSHDACRPVSFARPANPRHEHGSVAASQYSGTGSASDGTNRSASGQVLGSLRTKRSEIAAARCPHNDAQSSVSPTPTTTQADANIVGCQDPASPPPSIHSPEPASLMGAGSACPSSCSRSWRPFSAAVSSAPASGTPTNGSAGDEPQPTTRATHSAQRIPHYAHPGRLRHLTACSAGDIDQNIAKPQA